MSSSDVPADPPPSYHDATASSTPRRSDQNQKQNQRHSSHLEVPHGRNSSLPSAVRRSMEDEQRPLPKGWVRTFDSTTEHQFFVDTTQDPPRSIWTHPYDDEEYLGSLSSEERERIEEESMKRGDPPSKADLMASHTDDEDDEHHQGASGSGSSSSYAQELPPRPEGKGKGKDTRSFGRKFKDKVTGTTHEERESDRRRRAEQERQMYEQHLRMRQAMARAAQTGQPQFVGKDRDGKDVFIEPPSYQASPYGYPAGGYGYNPYGGPGVYTTPSARYVRPQAPYGRPTGGGFGGGYGLPLAIGGGLLGGLLLGDVLTGF